MNSFKRTFPAVIIVFSLFMLTNCNKEESKIVSFEVTKEGNNLKFKYTADSPTENYIISYGSSSNSSDPDQGNNFTTTNQNEVVKSLDALGIYVGEDTESFTFFIKPYDKKAKKASWSDAFVLNVTPTCPQLTNSTVFRVGDAVEFKWGTSDPSSLFSYYEVEYGLKGFALGEGTIVTTNSSKTRSISMTQNNIYDFYVRANCDNNIGWSEWAGPVGYFTDVDVNPCTDPSNLVWGIEYNFFGDPIGARLAWEKNYNSEFEYTVVLDGASPDLGQIETYYHSSLASLVYLSQNTDYHFYVRTLCVDGEKKSWIGPVSLNIGG